MDIEARITRLNAGIATLDDDLETMLQASPVWRENDELLQSAKGIGAVCARTFLLELPELGTLTRQQIAGFDHGAGHPSCLCARPKNFRTGGKRYVGLRFSSGVADTVIEAGSRSWSAWRRCIVTVEPSAVDATLWGGRAHVRTVLYMGTLVATRYNPPIRVLYQRLLAAGHVKTVALTACMQKFLTMLNAMLKHRTPWQPQEVPS